MHYDLWRKRGLPVGSGVAKAPASESSAADSMGLNAPLGKGRSQRLARRQTLFQEQPLGRLPRFEGLQCRSRLTKKRETHPIPVPPMPKIAIFCSLTLFCSSEHRSSFPRISMQASGERQSAASTGPDTRMHSAKCPVLDRECFPRLRGRPSTKTLRTPTKTFTRKPISCIIELNRKNAVHPIHSATAGEAAEWAVLSCIQSPAKAGLLRLLRRVRKAMRFSYGQ